MSVILPESFLDSEDMELCARFAKDGFIILDVENPSYLEAMQLAIAKLAAEYLKLDEPSDSESFLNNIHKYVSPENLNDLRLTVIQGLRNLSWFRATYYSLVKEALALLVGNELAMQRGVGLSVQLPHDTSSLLPIHADVWDGDSAYEVVVWLPLVNCFETKSMYIVPLEHDREIQAQMAKFQNGSAEDLYNEVADVAKFLTVGFGQVLIFSQTLMHGNRVNIESETRWSMNCRFKNLYAPFADKRLGEFFEPITMRPTSRLAADYELPGGFTE